MDVRGLKTTPYTEEQFSAIVSDIERKVGEIIPDGISAELVMVAKQDADHIAACLKSFGSEDLVVYAMSAILDSDNKRFLPDVFLESSFAKAFLMSFVAFISIRDGINSALEILIESEEDKQLFMEKINAEKEDFIKKENERGN